MRPHPDGVFRQLDFWPLEVAALPWGGRSPRELTRSFNTFIFEARADPVTCRFRDPNQLQLSLERRSDSQGPVYDGAPLLLPLTGGS